jgi:hypothetical protein
MARIIIAAIVAMLALAPVAEASGGWYQGGHGSSHKGGKYRNPMTGDYYRHRR